MRRALVGAAVAVLALTCLPAFADETVPTDPEAPAVLAECALPAGSERLTVDGFTGTIATPSALVGNERESRVFTLDLAGLAEGSTGSIEATMTWLVPANDYDLDVLAGRSSGTSENFQPFDPNTESVFAGGVAHCAKVTISAIDFLAPVVVDTLDLQATVTTKVPVA